METTLSKWSIVQQVNMENLLILTMDVMADLWNLLLHIQARDSKPTVGYLPFPKRDLVVLFQIEQISVQNAGGSLIKVELDIFQNSSTHTKVESKTVVLI